MERVQQYEILRLLGSGGFGVVFEARDPALPGKALAIKLLHGELAKDQGLATRFFQEALVLARLDHPSIPRVYSFGPWRETYFLVQDLVRGEAVSAAYLQRRAGAEGARALLRSLLEGVSYAHEKGVVHRDLKPENLVLSPEGLKLLDFGLSKILGGVRLTHAGGILGSLPYAAPEQLAAREVDGRSDLFSVGVILHWLLTGELPHEAPAGADFARALREQRAWAEGGDRGSLRALLPDVPADLESFYRTATAPDPGGRFQNAREALAALDGEAARAPGKASAASRPGGRAPPPREGGRAAFDLQVEATFDRPAYPDGDDPLVQVLVSLEASGEASYLSPVRAEVFLLLDVSGSMNCPDKYPLLRQAVGEFLARMAPDDRVGIGVFSSDAEAITPLIPGALAKEQAGLLLERMDSSGLLWGGTNLSPGLSVARRELELGGGDEAGVKRVYVLTDGEIYDTTVCQRVLDGFRENSLEVHVYGFGSGFNAQALRLLVSDQLGGSVKPICNQQDIVETFAHIAAVNRRLLARDGLLTVEFDPSVDCGDAFGFRPQERYLGPIAGRRFVRELGGVESGRAYSFLFELRLPPAEGLERSPVARVALSCRRGSERVERSEAVAAARFAGSAERGLPPEPRVMQAYQILDAMRQPGDGQAELGAARARLSLARMEGRDPGLIAALEKQIDVLEGRRSRSTLDQADTQYLDADMSSRVF